MIRMELKYCECCGGLLLRNAAVPAVYCGPCARRLRELPTVRLEEERRGRQAKQPPAAAAAAQPEDAPMSRGATSCVSTEPRGIDAAAESPQPLSSPPQYRSGRQTLSAVVICVDPNATAGNARRSA